MNDLWWVDAVDRHLAHHLGRCRIMRDFEVTLVLPSGDCGGTWVNWIRLTRIGPNRIQVLLDHDSGPFGKRLVVGRPGGHAAVREVFLLNESNRRDVYEPLDPEATVYHEFLHIVRGDAEPKRVLPPKPAYTIIFGSKPEKNYLVVELSKRHGGDPPVREDDGLWSFTVPL